MPRIVFLTGVQSSSATVGGFRNLIPGVEPGGGRVGKSKPALLITNAWGTIIDVVDAATTPDFQTARLFLVLSQEPDLTPGLWLLVAQMIVEKDGNAQGWTGVHQQDYGNTLGGLVFAPRFVGWGTVFTSGVDSVDWNLYLDYEVVELEWMDWFLHWDFLDNVPDQSEEF